MKRYTVDEYIAESCERDPDFAKYYLEAMQELDSELQRKRIVETSTIPSVNRNLGKPLFDAVQTRLARQGI